MKNGIEKQNPFNPFFSHIYIEKEIRNHPNTQRILAYFPKALLIEVNHYKDVFCRNHQDYRMQKESPCLILAKKENNLVYEGAPVCQAFGNRHFYYTSCVMNCIYDCEYCYLQGMYPSANLVVFVNLEDIFRQVELLLKEHPVYLCVSYDTDLLALEGILGYTRKWFEFAIGHPDLTIEVRTKSANWSALKDLEPGKNVILAWTLSPETIAEQYEHGTPALKSRLECMKKAMAKGYRVRLCLDPMLYCEDWKKRYLELFHTISDRIDVRKLEDISIGVFRVSQDYLKKMRKQAPACGIIQFPFENDRGVYHYGRELTGEMISFAYDYMKKEIPEEKIFLWEEAVK